MKRNFLKSMLAASLAATTLFAACNKDDDGTDTSTSRASLSVHLTDGPADYEAIFLDVEGVEVNTESDGWVKLPLIRAGFYDILQFRNGADTLLGRVDLPVGRVNEMRLILGEDSYLLNDGQTYDLKVPSGQSSGLKVKMNETLVANNAYDFWLDFDAGKSVHQTGNGQYMLKPVVRGYTTAANGRIRGYVLPAAASTTVYAINGADTFSAIPAPDGFFLVSGLPAGTYTVFYDASQGTYTDVSVPGVVVTQGVVTNLQSLTLVP